ncbi:MAG: energy-coupling factor transporter ATPase [Caldibacillus sp.]
MGDAVIEVKDLSFRYNKSEEKAVLSSLSFTVNKGEWIAIVGPNGSGKSTLANLLCGLLKPDQGTIYIKGKPLNDETIWEIREKMGVIFQNPDHQFIGTTVQDDVAFSLENMNLPYEEMQRRVDRALRQVGMAEYREKDPSYLSGGQKRRVSIAGILAMEPEIIIFDEAFTMLDPKSRRELFSLLKEMQASGQLTMVSITHDMEEAALADRIIVLNKGKISRIGTPGEVFPETTELLAPFSERLRRLLIQKGRRLPDKYMTETELIEWLWKYNFTT